MLAFFLDVCFSYVRGECRVYVCDGGWGAHVWWIEAVCVYVQDISKSFKKYCIFKLKLGNKKSLFPVSADSTNFLLNLTTIENIYLHILFFYLFYKKFLNVV